MFATFICKNCNTKLMVDFSKLDTSLNSCTKCKVTFVNSHYIDLFAEKFTSLQRALSNLEFCGLSSGNSDLFNLVYESDMETLDELYKHSSTEVKKLLSRILDINFLMVFHAAKDENLDALTDYIDRLEAILDSRNKFENDKFKNILFEDD